MTEFKKGDRVKVPPTRFIKGIGTVMGVSQSQFGNFQYIKVLRDGCKSVNDYHPSLVKKLEE